MLPANESELTELLHVIVGLGFPSAEQIRATGVPSLTVYFLTFGKIDMDFGLTGKREANHHFSINVYLLQAITVYHS